MLRWLFPIVATLGLLACDGGGETDSSREDADTAPAASSNPVMAGRYAPISVPMELKQVSPHVYYVQGAAGVATDNEGFISNAGVVVTDEGVVVFDSLGTPSLGAALLDRIRKLTDKPVVKVVVSHYHADHIYGLQVFKALGAEIVAPEGAQKYLDSPLAQERLDERRLSLDPWVDDHARLVRPDRYVSATERFSLGGVDMVISPVGGAHSDADMTLYVETDRVLFSGDIIFEGRIPYIGDANTKHWLEALERMETVGLAALIPGHGPAAQDPTKAIAATRRYLAFMREKMGAAVADLTPFAEAYVQVDWSEFEQVPAFEAANRRNAYAVFLSMEQEMLSGD
jgi:glyoxylase-like metal-dependent hydrolase (beta-lactamase superfamily II)